MYINRLFRSHICKLVFITASVAGYFLVPEKVLTGYYSLLAAGFILSLATSITCMVKNTKERITTAKTAGSTTLSAVAAGLGITALNFCGVGAPVCTASIGAGILSAVLPGFLMRFVLHHAVTVVVMTILFQILAVYLMGCFSSRKG